MSFDEVSFDEISIDEMSFDEMSFDEILFNEMSFDEMSFDEMRCRVQIFLETCLSHWMLKLTETPHLRAPQHLSSRRSEL